MSARVVSLADVRNLRRDWTSDDIAQFQRAANVLRQVGLPVETDHGLSDEGDPWFVFCHAETGETFAHFARVNGVYVACAPHLDSSLTGRAFPELVERFLDRYPTVAIQRAGGSGGQHVYMHPMTALAALVATLFFVANPQMPGDHAPAATDTTGSADLGAPDPSLDAGGVIRLLANAADTAIHRNAQRAGREDDKSGSGYFSDRAGMIIAVLAATSAISMQEAEAGEREAAKSEDATGIAIAATSVGSFELGCSDDDGDGTRGAGLAGIAQRVWLADKTEAASSSTVRLLPGFGDLVIVAGAGEQAGADTTGSTPTHGDVADLGLFDHLLETPELAPESRGGGNGASRGDAGRNIAIAVAAEGKANAAETAPAQSIVAAEPTTHTTATAEMTKPASHVTDVLRDVFGSLDQVNSLLRPAADASGIDLSAIAFEIASASSIRMPASASTTSVFNGSPTGAAAGADGSTFASDPSAASAASLTGALSGVAGPTGSEAMLSANAGAATGSPSATGEPGTDMAAETAPRPVIHGTDVDWQALDVALVTRLFLATAVQVSVTDLGQDVVLFERNYGRDANWSLQVERFDLDGDNDMIIVGSKATFDEMAHQIYG